MVQIAEVLGARSLLASVPAELTALGISKPSVSHAVTALRDGGFLIVEEDYCLHLTDV